MLKQVMTLQQYYRNLTILGKGPNLHKAARRVLDIWASAWARTDFSSDAHHVSRCNGEGIAAFSSADGMLRLHPTPASLN